MPIFLFILKPHKAGPVRLHRAARAGRGGRGVEPVKPPDEDTRREKKSKVALQSFFLRRAAPLREDVAFKTSPEMIRRQSRAIWGPISLHWNFSANSNEILADELIIQINGNRLQDREDVQWVGERAQRDSRLLTQIMDQIKPTSDYIYYLTYAHFHRNDL